MILLIGIQNQVAMLSRAVRPRRTIYPGVQAFQPSCRVAEIRFAKRFQSIII
jgi:hypothetical protein